MKTNTRKITGLILSAIMTVSMTITMALPASAAITDVKPTDWYHDAVQFNKNNNMIVDLQNYKANNPAPRKDVTYALYKLVNGKDSTPTDIGTFLPVDTTSLSNDYKYSAQWCVKNNIIKGTKSEGYKTWFSPEMIITREQMATILYRTAEYKGLDTTNYSLFAIWMFNDGNKISSWAENAMAWCVSNRLMFGTGNNNLSPKDTLTFAQLAQFMMNYNDYYEQATTTVTPTPTPVPTPKPGSGDDSSWVKDYCNSLTDLSGPWDNVASLKDQNWLPNGGYMKDGHRYNKYDVCIDDVDGIPNDEEKRAFLAINQHRANNGIAPITWDQSMQALAEIRAIEAYKCHTGNSEWAHLRPNGDDTDGLLNEIGNMGILATKTPWMNWFDECVAHAFQQGYDPVAMWINSPAHNEGLKDTKATYGAVAYSFYNYKTIWSFNTIRTN